ncbi:hypothetical protein N0B31_01485 [Salinirubellus salinus]|uniref:Uncharacterized protein n=1 Tax=Salinirubellus salinus TaxID=1364945 RepID=A0A9E7UB96_9EURY|nr:hypothetical protein [Salinirubellus salinus]UWM54963.1 hypothetical protein N0B31_01485 [Salinirubellus salinus]
MSGTRLDGDDPSRRDRIASVVRTALGEWNFLLPGVLFAGTLLYALVNPSLGASEPASEAVFAVVALVLLGVVVWRTARKSDAVPYEEERDGPGVRP